jgi:hypothetical protein
MQRAFAFQKSLYQNTVSTKTTAKIKMMKKTRNNNLEISADTIETPGKPKTPARIAMKRKMNAHFNIKTSLGSASANERN